MKNIRAILTVIVVCVLTIYMLSDNSIALKVFAKDYVVVRVPDDSSLFVDGKLVGPESISGKTYKDGRIHHIARRNINTLYGITEYKVSGDISSSRMVVIDKFGKNLVPTKEFGSLIEYIGGSDVEFVNAVSERVMNATIAYHNRCGGYNKNTFSSYFMDGSDAYNKGILSDEGRKYGQNVNAPTIKSVKVSEVYRYSDTAFTAKADIVATGTYVETYSIYFLFQWNGSNYFVTHYTYRD